MTREELKEHCEKQMEMCELWAIGQGEEPSGKIYEEHKLILELLEQQPSEDCISRQAAQNKIKEICNKYRLSYEDGERKPATGGSAYALGHAFDDMPPVTPQTRKGHWIYKEFDERTGITNAHICSKCGYPLASPYKSFCSACGSDNREVKE